MEELVFSKDIVIDILKFFVPVFVLPPLVFLSVRFFRSIFETYVLVEPQKSNVDSDDPVIKSGRGYKVRMDDGSYVFVDHSDLYPDDPPEQKIHAGNYIWNSEAMKFVRKD